jgi:catechol 2,3-dioxygenase-like lactoylglutathione lyase family enzyme
MIAALDHLVLTVRDMNATCAFYKALGMSVRTFAQGRTALHYGRQKINLHPAGNEFEPKAARATPGSADLCFLVDRSLDEVEAAMCRHGIAVIEGPVDRTGAQGPIRSLYCRDPDGNLIELSRPIT